MAPDNATPIDVAYVAKLARIALDDAERERFANELGALLEYVAQLDRLPLDAVSATAQVVPSQNVVRDDVLRPSLPRDVVLAAAPQTENGYFRVPRIIGKP